MVGIISTDYGAHILRNHIPAERSLTQSHIMDLHQCELPELTKSNLPQWVAAVDFEAAAVNIVAQAGSRL